MSFGKKPSAWYQNPYFIQTLVSRKSTPLKYPTLGNLFLLEYLRSRFY